MSEPLFYILVDRQQTGPFPLSRLQEMWNGGMLGPQTLFWKQGQAGWEPLSTIASQLGAGPAPSLRHLMPPSISTATAVTGGTRARSSGLGFAVASLVCGLAGLLVGLPALAAIICGHVARHRLRNAPGVVRGKVMATIGLGLGWLVVAVFAVITGFIFLVDQGRGTAFQELAHARRIGSALQHYAADHQGHTPPDLGALVPGYLPDHSVFLSPLAGEEKEPGYELMLADTDLGTVQDPAHTVLLRSHYQTRKGYRACVYADGHAIAQRD